ncbi:hypothetical protein Tco_0123597 [Tanacetum coccineum]
MIDNLSVVVLSSAFLYHPVSEYIQFSLKKLSLIMSDVLKWFVIMSDVLKWFVDTKNNGYIEFLCFLLVGYDTELELPSLVWPKLLTAYTNYVELVDARANVYMVKKDRDYKDSAWSFNGSEWVSVILTFKDLNPKIIHFEQIDLKTFLVNFYTKDGNEVDYVFTKDHEMKCVVVGCHDPRMYQVLSGRDYAKLLSFLQQKRSFDESGCSFVGKVINGVVADTETRLDSATGENSNASAGSEKTFISMFSSCIDTKGYMSIPVAFHCHRMCGGYRDVWVNARGRSLYMSIKSHIDERAKTKKNTNVYLVGEMHRLKEVLVLNVGDRMVFELVSGNISSDEPMFFNVSKLV